ncbi:MBL fold metallo-hydrolase [Yoonia vestfoldensis]|jgi:glyoxylase-like metal-dependent hydrolase (beta-lactamase superfamily II)|uniref:Hydroxyacylglutathione hydrolase n=1 Tax=Yoonia vestfoldensis TaxID=245188 RepID=A0A1Y0EFD5_9RHOB|nr:MBL fold metallo-hydrolase [Yoonia vestfoldensis]ARU02297.1 hydroxyacylglutathione hydrolase [Yoonia vestfoldensis]
MPLPVAENWFTAKQVGPDVTLILEPHVHVLEQANMFLVQGRDRDMILDTGMGIVPLRPFLDTLRADPDKDIICVSSHTHIDHIGGVHEFATRLVHPTEAAEMAAPSGLKSLYRDDMPARLIQTFLDAGYPPLDEVLIDALPYAGYDPRSYVLRGAPATGLLDEGDSVDLGDHLYEVIHLPGHSPGGIGLYERATGVLFAGDAIYDGPLIYDGPGMSVPDYLDTFAKLRALDIALVHGGHDPSFGPDRLDQIMAKYEAIWRG